MISRRFAGFATIFLTLSGCIGCARPFSHELVSRPVLTTGGATNQPISLPARESAEACLTVGQTMASQGHDTEAIAQYERARQYDPRARGVAHRLAILYDRTADLKRANAEFQLALKEEPRNPDLLNDVGYFCYNRGRWAEAEQYFRNAIAAKPDHAKAWNNLGLTLAQQERWQESLEAFGKVVSPSEAKSNLAFILTTRGKREEAKALYRQALADESDSKIARGALDRLENAGNKTTTEPKPLGYEVIPVPPRG